jgi:carbon storage regulator
VLVLSRKKNETIIIVPPASPIIKVVCVEIRGDKVRMGFEAPTDVQIHRLEVYEAILRNKRQDGWPTVEGGQE